MKLKQLFAAALLVCSTGAWAQTDVTSTYLTNANFEADEALTATYLYGYGKDGSPYGLQPITGWTSVVTAGDNSNNSYPNSGMAGGVFSYGSSTQLKGNSKAAPATNPDGEASGKCFGFFGVWSCGGYYYQNVTLAAGKYTITVPMYNQSGTQANTTYTGFFPTSGTNKTVAVNPTVGQWVDQTVTFTLTAETAGQIRVGYQSTGNGSGANPHLFIDGVKIEFTAIVVKDVLETALAAATKANATLSNSDLTSAITTAQSVYDDVDATQEEVNNAAATLNTATELAMSAVGDVTSVFLSNPGFDSCAPEGSDVAVKTIIDYSSNGWTNTATGGFTTIAVTAYGGGKNVGGSTTPSTKKDGTTVSGNTLGIIAGWGDDVTIQSNDVTLPAGVYTLTVDHYLTSSTSNYGNNSSKFGFVTSDGSYLVSNTTFSASTWTTETVTFTLTESTTGKIQIGLTGLNKSGSGSPAVFYDDITITYQSFLAGAKDAWDEAKAAAEAARDNAAYDNVTGAEKVALLAEIAKAEPNTADGYDAAAAALTSATSTFTAAKANYDALVAEIAYAKTIGIASETADDYAATSESTAATALTSTQNLKVLEYTTINAAYANEVSSLLGEWNKGNYDTTSGQGYTGSETYFDKWSGSATDLTSSATVTLPAGKYVVKVAGRGVSTTTMNLSVKVGEADAVNTPFLMNGDTGKGIDTAGATNFSEEGSYSNNNIGRGWQYRYITFEADGSSEITVAVNGHLNNGTWQSFYAPVLLCNDATYATVQLIAAKAELQAAIDAAPAVMTENIGTGAFQFAEAGVNTYAAALETAQAAHDAAEATVSSIEAAKTALATAIETYNALEMKAPEATQAYNIVFNSDGHDADGNALTLIPNPAQTQGGYGLKYLAPANTNLAQAFYFTHTTGNKYKVAAIDQDDETRYITTQAEGYETTWYDGIRTTTDASKAMEIEIRPNGEGLYLLWNTGANKAIAHNGNNNNDMFTNYTANFQFVETTKPSITINTTAAGWGTVILPFAHTLSVEGVKAYTCAAVDGNTLTLEEVEGGALEANKPYIIEGAWNETVTGDAQGTALSYTEGLLTGVYTTQAAPNGSYILQNQDDKVGFYLVDTSEAQPNVPANRAYLTVDSGSGVKAFFFDKETGINGVLNEIAAGNIFDLSGRKVAKMQKGQTYIIGNKKVNVK
ncbi:MAG: hypothetical protein IJQ44_00165 [Bacteroidaceae bacterium]|nr:hypothetical protein [Bacteroidaceae bacterium]